MPIKKQRIVIKIGSNVLALTNGGLDLQRIEHLSSQIAQLKKAGYEVIVVSSGAVAAGRSLVTLPKNFDVINRRQLLAAVGQVKLLNIYAGLFEKLGFLCAQVLVTKEDFRDREHYLNMKNCLTVLLQQNVIPILNENDVVSVTELMFTDNDELAGMVSSMMQADKLLLLSNVNGIYDGPPGASGSKVIPIIEYGDTDFAAHISPEKSNFGRGGMITKCTMAHKVAGLGIPVYIANGKTNNLLSELLLENKATGTLFKAKKTTSSVKKWVAHSEGFVKGKVIIDSGASKALSSDVPTSLLPVGISRIEGSFKTGDVVQICDKNGKSLGVGKAQYSSEKAQELLGKKNQKPLVHYDYLFLNQD